MLPLLDAVEHGFGAAVSMASVKMRVGVGWTVFFVRYNPGLDSVLGAYTSCTVCWIN